MGRSTALGMCPRDVRRAACALALAGFALGACAPPEDTVELAALFDPRDLWPGSGEPVPFATDIVLRRADEIPWLESQIGPGGSPADATPWPTVLRAHASALALHPSFGHQDLSPQLGDSSDQWEYRDFGSLELAELVERENPTDSLAFTVVGEDLMLVYPGDGTLERPLLARQPLSFGHRTGDHWRVALGAFGGDGVPVWPGQSWQVELPAAGARRLTAWFTGLALPLGGDATPPPLTWTVEFDGTQLGAGELELSVGEATWAPVDLELPTRSGVLRFSVAGAAAMSAFLNPRIAPVRHSPGHRRPDVVVFLADTFRADLLGHGTSVGSLTPELDRFAAGAVMFERAWSPSSWTLPSHGSLFTGLQPVEHGAIRFGTRLSDDAVTLAERLRAAGYRTLALTDGANVSRVFGMDQGFELFLEEDNWGQLELGNARLASFLAMDDPRPLFLFFHTYRTHGPYHVSAETAARLGPALGLGRTWDELLDVVLARVNEGSADLDDMRFEPTEVAEALALYRGGAADLDQAFGAWLGVLKDAGRADGVVLFTSDHGEAFAERAGFIGHGSGLWEEETRVPLVVRAPGLAPGSSPAPAGLVDVPRTVAALVNLAPAREWGGRALLGRHAEGRQTHEPLELFAEPTQIAVVEGNRKLHAVGANLTLLAVHDLESDPGEQQPATPPLLAWANQRLETLRADADRWRTPRFETVRVRWRPELDSQLRALGYIGDE